MFDSSNYQIYYNIHFDRYPNAKLHTIIIIDQAFIERVQQFRVFHTDLGVGWGYMGGGGDSRMITDIFKSRPNY